MLELRKGTNVESLCLQESYPKFVGANFLALSTHERGSTMDIDALLTQLGVEEGSETPSAEDMINQRAAEKVAAFLRDAEGAEGELSEEEIEKAAEQQAFTMLFGEGGEGEEVDEETMAKEAEALFDDAVKDRAQQMVEDFMVEQMVEEEAVKTAEATIAVLSDPDKLEKISSLIEQAEEEPEFETDAVAAFQAWLARG